MEESYSINEVTAMRINADTWNTDIMVSADENIHIHFDGSISNGEEKPSTSLQNGIYQLHNKVIVRDCKTKYLWGKRDRLRFICRLNVISLLHWKMAWEI